MDNKIRAFTYYVPENHRQSIVFDIGIGVSLPIPNAPRDIRGRLSVKALVDTGASRSAVSARFAESARLVPFGKTDVHTAKGTDTVSVYTVDVFLPNNVWFPQMFVSEFKGASDFDFIIGMDILSKGDMSITNADGRTVFSFRMPPNARHIDFTEGLDSV